MSSVKMVATTTPKALVVLDIDHDMLGISRQGKIDQLIHRAEVIIEAFKDLTPGAEIALSTMKRGRNAKILIDSALDKKIPARRCFTRRDFTENYDQLRTDLAREIKEKGRALFNRNTIRLLWDLDTAYQTKHKDYSRALKTSQNLSPQALITVQTYNPKRFQECLHNQDLSLFPYNPGTPLPMTGGHLPLATFLVPPITCIEINQKRIDQEKVFSSLVTTINRFLQDPSEVERFDTSLAEDILHDSREIPWHLLLSRGEFNYLSSFVAALPRRVHQDNPFFLWDEQGARPSRLLFYAPD